MKWGISLRHGGHHVPRRGTITTLPLKSLSDLGAFRVRQRKGELKGIVLGEQALGLGRSLPHLDPRCRDQLLELGIRLQRFQVGVGLDKPDIRPAGVKGLPQGLHRILRISFEGGVRTAAL